MTLFYFKFIVTNILFSVIMGAVLVRHNRGPRESGAPWIWETMLYALGLGPAFIVLLLYFLMLLLPRQGNMFYLMAVILGFAVLAILGRTGFAILATHGAAFFTDIKKTWQTTRTAQKIKKGAYILVVLILLVVYWIGFSGTIQHNRLEGHDALIYGNFGKMYYHDQRITYTEVMLPASNGFLFQGTPKPAFSLLLTWELLLNHAMLDKKQEVELNKTNFFDTYYRSTSGYYALLILVLVFLWLYRIHPFLPFVGILALASGLNFFLMTADLHLDSIRIYFLMLSWIWLAYSIERKDSFSLFMLAMFSGFAAFFHLIGLAIALINGLAFFLFTTHSWKKRVGQTALFFLLMVLFGGIHYVLEGLGGAESGFSQYIAKLLFFLKN